MARLRIGVDTGGTFTDFVVLDEETGRVEVAKWPSTRHAPHQAIVEGLRTLLAAREEAIVGLFAHGTTVGTNAVLEGRGAKTGLLITEGFRGIYEVREQARGQGSVIYDLFFERPPALVPPRLTEEVGERVTYDGTVLRAPEEAPTKEAILRLLRHGVESIAVAFLFSFLYPEHERRVGEWIAELAPELPVSLSSEVVPQIREYYRLSTTVVNAYLSPLMSRYLGGLEAALDQLGVDPHQRYVMRSNGGVASFSVVRRRSVETILSGPAAGVVAAARFGAAAGLQNLITFDMGGTSTDVALIEGGRPDRRQQGKIQGYDVLIPMLDIHTVAAGGGTLAWVDALGHLEVGPSSAGSDPGPACYGRGGEGATVTDANVVLGYLPSDHPLAGGRLRLRPELAEAAIRDRVAHPLGLGVLEAARGIREVVNVKMQEAIKVVSSNRGYDLRDFYLFAFGGAGPLHAAELAAELGMRGVIVPPFPGVTSALGLIWSDVRHDFVRSELKPWQAVDPEAVQAQFRALQAQGEARLRHERHPEAAWRFEYALDLRYRGQGYELTVPLTMLPHTREDLQAIREAYDRLHERTTGHSAPEEAVEVVSYRLTAVAELKRPPWSFPYVPLKSLEAAFLGTHPVFWDGRLRETPLWQRTGLPPGAQIAGPAILVQADATTVVPPGQLAEVDPELGHLVIRPR
ncbi:MAG: hydantoinase/oxoprolinase family protein [Firmicutes bacterium]|nr:hydantoinase/oxoprolinase family protein [Bacillota bacterium]